MKSPATVPFAELAKIAEKASRKADAEARQAGVAVTGLDRPKAKQKKPHSSKSKKAA
jgi:hypothetical protein